jgi:hypothetical protein
MKKISLYLDDALFGETEKMIDRTKKPRNLYISEAIACYNRIQERLLAEQKRSVESNQAARVSPDMNKEVEKIDYCEETF